MNAIFTVLKEQIKNFYLIQRLAQFQLKISNHDNYLGLAWEIINPLIQIGVYYFVFGLGIRGNHAVHGVPFFLWMLVGISMWFFVNQGILEGTKSIGMKFNQVSKMNFPLSTIPSYILMSKFYAHLVLVVFVIVLCAIQGIYPSIYILQLLIYIPWVYIFALSVTMLTSTLAVLIRDTQMMVQSILRILFYLSPILWEAKGNSHIMQFVQTTINLNPISYLANSYRSAILYHKWHFIEHPYLTLYNIAFVILFFSVGSILHMKFRHRFSDFM
ncbi:ABC transporter permease [Macrococcus sp. DPC7161]|uniref:ABC transporter permease n=1 Tax=Macrococcus sp. DPC7161 TaxID=2507060 RepID=UPI00100C1075|nr:ABC transporter permease [Macrococcus sp. DPC7161]RXK18796.1 ABC transporter permease [Macrococcus sp. DPC7161]